MLGKLLGKKEKGNEDIESLKARFNGLNAAQPAPQQFAQNPNQPLGQPQSYYHPNVQPAQPGSYPQTQPQGPQSFQQPAAPAQAFASIEPPIQPEKTIQAPIPPGARPAAASGFMQPPAHPAVHPSSSQMTAPFAQPSGQPIHPQMTAPSAGQPTSPQAMAHPSGQPTYPQMTPPSGQPIHFQASQPGHETTSTQLNQQERAVDGAPQFEVVEVINNPEAVSLDGNPLPEQPSSPKAPEDTKLEKMGVTKISKYLDNLKNELDDTKLTSLIIQQVKELIEIDQNLNNKIKDLEDNLRKEAKEREKLRDVIDKHYEEFKKNEKNMDKFIALYEVVTNQFNPFVDKGMHQDVEVKPAKSQPTIPDLPQENDDHDSGLMHSPLPSSPSVPTPSPSPLPSSPSASSPTPVPYAPVPSSSVDPLQQIGSANQGIVPKQSPNQRNNSYPTAQFIDIPAELHFKTKDGQLIRNLPELVSFLKGMPSDVFTHHVTETGNDFAAWVHHVLRNEQLAQELGPIKNRLDMIRAIMSHL